MARTNPLECYGITRTIRRGMRQVERRQKELYDFSALIARMTTEQEMEGGMVSEDAICTLNQLIASAREVTGINPGYPEVYCGICGRSCLCQEEHHAS